MLGNTSIFNRGKSCRYLAFGFVLCLLAVVIGTWLGWTMRANAPAGYELTGIPGIYVKDRTTDLGMISPNRLVEATFDLFNANKKAYVVKNVSADCGCATVNLTDQTLRPNESLKVPLKVDTSKLKGNAFRKGVLVELTRPGHEHVWKDVFRLAGTIDRSGTFIVWPGSLDYGDVAFGTNSHKTLYFKADQALLEVLPPAIEIKQPSEMLSLPQVKYTGRLAIKPIEVRLAIAKVTQSEMFESSINVEVAGSPPRQIVIPVRARLVDGVIIRPESIYMAVSTEGNRPSVDLTLRSAHGERLSIKEISSSLPLKWAVDKEPTSDSALVVTFMPSDGADPDGPLCGDIQIQMSNGSRQTVPGVMVPVKSVPLAATNSVKDSDSTWMK